MRLALIAAVTTVTGFGACALPPTESSYGYGYPVAPSAPATPYYDGGYAPNPYYEQPGYAAPYFAPGPAIIVGGERRFDDRERYRYDRRGPEQGFQGRPNQPPPGREFGGRSQGRPEAPPRPGPTPVALPPQNRPGPSPGPGPQFGSRGHAPDFNPANPTAQGGADR